LVFDSINAKSAESILVESENLTAIGADQSRIRVVNATRGLPPLTVALGARYEQKSSKYPFSYSSGIILSSKQEFGDISSPVSLSKGTIPINVFTASEPAKLLYSARASIKENKSYLMVLTTDDNNNLKVILIDDELENTNVQYLEEGIFVQVVNAYSGENNLKISFNSQGGESAILVDAEVNFTNSIATVIDNKSQMISVNGINYEIIPETDKRVLVVATGDANSIRIFSNNFEPLNDNSTFKFRFVNASDIEILNVKKNTTDEAYIETIVKDNFSSYSTELRERKITYHFFDGDITGYIKRINDVLFTLGKSYSIIFTGFTTQNCFREYDKKNPNQEPNCYFIIIQQEF